MDWTNVILTIFISVTGAIVTSLVTLGKYREKVDRIEKDLDKTEENVLENS